MQAHEDGGRVPVLAVMAAVGLEEDGEEVVNGLWGGVAAKGVHRLAEVLVEEVRVMGVQAEEEEEELGRGLVVVLAGLLAHRVKNPLVAVSLVRLQGNQVMQAARENQPTKRTREILGRHDRMGERERS